MTILGDKIRVALDILKKADPMMVTAISELRAQGYTTEADNLQLVLDDLRTETDAAVAAVNI
jgi:hypothetical protein